MIISLCSASILFVLLGGTDIYSNVARQLNEFVADSDLPNYTDVNTTNPHENGWCKDAVCRNNPICTPCNQRYLFILAPGRTGSTTLLEMFNRLPGLRLSGENYNELNGISNLFHNLFDHKENFQYDVSIAEGPFEHNAIPNGSLSCAAQHFVNTLNPPYMDITTEHSNYHQEQELQMILGMKTVRLSRGEGHAFSPTGAVKFLEDNFPCSRFIIAKRSNHQAHAESMHTNLHLGIKKQMELSNVIDLAKSLTSFYDELQTRLGPDKARTVDLDEWMTDVDVLNDAVSWLGFTNCRFDGILHENHDGYLQDHHAIHFGEDCKAPV